MMAPKPEPATSPPTVPLSDLVEDFSVYPRHQVDSTHVTTLALALQAGEPLPPLAVERATTRIVDGFHRARAYRRVFGETGAAPVEWCAYSSPAALILDAIRRNSAHGRRLDAMDRTRAIRMAEVAGATVQAISVVLRMPEAAVLRVRPRVVLLPRGAGPVEDAIPGTNEVPTKPSYEHLKGVTLTPKQARVLGSQPGVSHTLLAGQLADAISSDLINWNNARLVVALTVLHRTLGTALAAHLPAPP